MKRVGVFALLAMMFVGCVQDKVDDVSVKLGDPQKIFAAIDMPENRVQLDENQRTTWTEKDQIVVLNQTEYSLYQFDGKTGDRDGSFTKIGVGGTPSESYVFNGKSYAVYPYDTYYNYSGFSDGTPAIFSWVMNEQSYLEDSYGLHANIMLGESEDGWNYRFKNLLGYLCLNLTGEKCVKSIKLSSNNGEYICGLLYYAVTDVNAWGWYANVETSITLNCGEGVQLSQTPTKFYFTMPTVTLSGGFTIEVNFTDGTNFVKQTTNSLTINRNTIQPMKALSTIVDESSIRRAYIYHSGSTIYTPYINTNAGGCVYWGDGTYSMYSSVGQFHDYTDSKPSHVITIEAENTSELIIYNCQGISKIDLSNF